MTNSADPGQLASDLHCLQREGISGFSRTRINVLLKVSWLGMYDLLYFFPIHLRARLISDSEYYLDLINLLSKNKN